MKFLLAALATGAWAGCPSCEEENMCGCRGFPTSSFEPEVVLYEKAEKQVTCADADLACDLKWAVLCCAGNDMEEQEERKLQTLLEFETAADFCSRNGFPLETTFNPLLVAYPSGGSVGPTGMTTGTCASVVADGEDLFAQCCCTDSAYCCPQGADADDCEATQGEMMMDEIISMGSYSYSFSMVATPPMLGNDFCPSSGGLDRSVCMENGGHDADCCAMEGSGSCALGYTQLTGHSCTDKGTGMAGYATCCYEGCVDSSTWYAKGNPDETCEWVAEDPDTRCYNSRSEDNVAAYYSCPYSCGKPCFDSTSWYRKGDSTKDCAWVSVFPQKRCDLKGDDKTLASYSCPLACDSELEEIDSPSWYKTDEPQKTCSWVSILPDARCDTKGHDGTVASYSCPVACGFNTTYVDNPAWYKKSDPSKDCKWVSTFATARCDVVGWNDEIAMADSMCERACYGVVLSRK